MYDGLEFRGTLGCPRPLREPILTPRIQPPTIVQEKALRSRVNDILSSHKWHKATGLSDRAG